MDKDAEINVERKGAISFAAGESGADNGEFMDKRTSDQRSQVDRLNFLVAKTFGAIPPSIQNQEGTLLGLVAGTSFANIQWLQQNRPRLMAKKAG